MREYKELRRLWEAMINESSDCDTYIVLQTNVIKRLIHNKLKILHLPPLNLVFCSTNVHKVVSVSTE